MTATAAPPTADAVPVAPAHAAEDDAADTPVPVPMSAVGPDDGPYVVALDIPVFVTDAGRYAMPCGLARDLLAQASIEPRLRLVCPRADRIEQVDDPYEVDAAEHPGLSFGLLPWNGMRRTFPAAYLGLRNALRAEAAGAGVWHSGCSRNLWDLCQAAFAAGRHTNGLRVLCLDSDPAEMEQRSGWLGRRKAPLLRAVWRKRAGQCDATVFVGRGAAEAYGEAAKRSVQTAAVWLTDGDLAAGDAAAGRFDDVRAGEPARFVLPTRLTAWKGVDDALHAFASLREESDGKHDDTPRPWRLDVVGHGAERQALQRLAERLGLADVVRFLDPTPYGPPFFALLRGYHAVLVPTRATEEARIVYDAAASGCVLIHSATSTLEAALADLALRWTHRPGDADDLAQTLRTVLGDVDRWPEASRAGVRFMDGRTIDRMHRQRSAFLAGVREELRA